MKVKFKSEDRVPKEYLTSESDKCNIERKIIIEFLNTIPLFELKCLVNFREINSNDYLMITQAMYNKERYNFNENELGDVSIDLNISRSSNCAVYKCLLEIEQLKHLI